jgi:hypothetical protein
MKEYKYLNLFYEMRKNKEFLKDVAELLDVTPQTISAKLAGEHDWTIGEIETLCEHYNKDYYELFKKD